MLCPFHRKSSLQVKLIVVLFVVAGLAGTLRTVLYLLLVALPVLAAGSVESFQE